MPSDPSRMPAVEVETYYTGLYLSVAVIILSSVMSTFYYVRVVKVMYFEKKLVGNLYYPIKNQKTIILSFLIGLQLILFVNPDIIFLVTHSSAITSADTLQFYDTKKFDFLHEGEPSEVLKKQLTWNHPSNWRSFGPDGRPIYTPVARYIVRG